MLKSFVRTALWCLVVVFALTNPVVARQSNEHSTKAERAADAVKVLNEIMSIPETLFRKT
jgi:hypothetical protein